MDIKEIILNDEVWEAVKFIGDNHAEIIGWSGEEINIFYKFSDNTQLLEVPVRVKTDLYGNISYFVAELGDWILKKPKEHEFQILKLIELRSINNSISLNDEVWEAVKFTGNNFYEIEEWSGEEISYVLYDSDPFKFFHFMRVPVININGIEYLCTKVGDWVLKKPNEHIFQTIRLKDLKI
jgi:hypothetical protein